MADTILDSITKQYHTLTKSGKKLADYVFSIQPRPNIFPFHRLLKTARYQKLPSRVSVEDWDFPVIMLLN